MMRKCTKIKKHEYDKNRVEFYSINNMANGMYLSRAEPILKSAIKSVYEDINDVLELYNIKQYFDNELYLQSWTKDDIADFKQKVTGYAKIVGQFMANIDDNNVISYYEQLVRGYVNSFWKLLNDQQVYKRISAENFAIILSEEPHEIRNILRYKNLVTNYDIALKDFLLAYPQSAELLLSIYEQKNDFQDKEPYVPKSLSVQDKENIISTYLDSENPNLNYIQLIQKVRDRQEFKISPKTKLKAQRKEEEQTKYFFNNNSDAIFQYGVSVGFKEQMEEPLQINSEGLYQHYTYSLDCIKENTDNYSLFQNFRSLFFYLDEQWRIKLVCKKNELDILETVFIHSKNEYLTGTSFNLSEKTSLCQIAGYDKIINDLGNSLENILQSVFTSILQEKYNFANNARLSMPAANISCFEKIRLLIPEFESVLKQYKLFVENGEIDFELLQISSTPCAIKDIPSLIPNKYIYLNEDNKETINCSSLFFSDQTLLAYVEPYKEKHYHTFFDLLSKEQVNFNSYEDHQKPKLNYLIEKGFISLDKNNNILAENPLRIIILKDLYDNEFASFYRYQNVYQEEAKRMADENMIVFESSLFAKPEQCYFNYYLNKSEFTNGLDLRNSYVHGTQANPEDIANHQDAYFTYLKLLVLALLKIEDDLLISQRI